MTLLTRIPAYALAMALLTGCQTPVVRDNPLLYRTGEVLLEEGIRQFEDANYRAATGALQRALQSGLTRASEVKAHKYLAFVHCINGRKAQCRDEFRATVKLDPKFDLKPEEAGHPMWGPVFREVKTDATRG
ncbi:MAG: TssQ family T6SS-associated lipoprotein [Burkholderiales bacterium]